MKRLTVIACMLLILSGSPLQLLAADVDPGKAEFVRLALTIGGTAAGLGVGLSTGLAFSSDAIDAPLSSTLLLTIPVAAAGAATGALACAWMADVALRHQPPFFFSIIEGAGLGVVAGGFVGAVTFSLNFAIAEPLLDMPEGYWGEPPIPVPLMAAVAGGFWGAFFGAIAGAIVLPLVALYMGF